MAALKIGCKRRNVLNAFSMISRFSKGANDSNCGRERPWGWCSVNNYGVTRVEYDGTISKLSIREIFQEDMMDVILLAGLVWILGNILSRKLSNDNIPMAGHCNSDGGFLSHLLAHLRTKGFCFKP